MTILIIIGLLLIVGIIDKVSQEILNRRILSRLSDLETEVGIKPDNSKKNVKK